MVLYVNKGGRNTNGFTIVELTVVIAVIGILVAITVFSYGNWRERTIMSQVQSDLNGVASAMENARNFGPGYPTALPTTFSPSSNVRVTYVRGDSRSYCINATSTDVTSVQYHIDSSVSGRTPVPGTC